jgi:hypothetical protein
LTPPTHPTPSGEPRLVSAIKAHGRLMRGAEGSHVRELQEQLQRLGYLTTPADETFGEATEAAVKLAQHKLSLPTDGVVDITTAQGIAGGVHGGAQPGGPTKDALVRNPENKSKVVVNETNKRLVITEEHGQLLVLAPLERRTLDEGDFKRFESLLDELQRESKVAVPQKESSDALALIVGGAIWALIIFGIVGLFRGSSSYWLVGAGAIAAALAITIVAHFLGKSLLRWTAQLAALIIILAIGIALPASAIYFSAGVDQLVQAAYMDGTLAKEDLDLTLLGRGLQLLFLTAVSLLPALLYFLFDRQQLRTLREQFERHMFRLDRNMETLTDIRARYGTLMGEAYGPEAARGGGRLVPGRRSPVLLATIVITMGWLLTLLKPEIGLITDRDGIVQLFQPDPSAIVFGFLGAYFFALMTIQRGYARGDLRPKTYTQITVRIFIAVIFAWVLELLPGANDASYLLLLAFATGIVPETALVAIQETLRGKQGKVFGRWVTERDPLTKLEGIDLYDRARLLDEGVSNVEGLAHHDLIELLLQTRVPAPRIVDWIDQAILYLHVGSTEGQVKATRECARQLLNGYGIRTATDLEQAYFERSPDEREEFVKILPSCDTESTLPRLSVIVDTLRDEEWMDNLRYWHDGSHLVEGTLWWPPSTAPDKTDTAADEAASETEAVTGEVNGRPAAATPASRAPAG